MSNNAEQLIQQIMNEVKDPALRDSLLMKIAGDSSVKSDKSLIVSELNKLGLEVNQEAAEDLVKFGAKSEVGAGYLVGVVFVFLGVFLCFGSLAADSTEWVFFWGAIFGLVGLYSISGTNKMKRSLNLGADKM